MHVVPPCYDLLLCDKFVSSYMVHSTYPLLGFPRSPPDLNKPMEKLAYSGIAEILLHSVIIKQLRVSNQIGKTESVLPSLEHLCII